MEAAYPKEYREMIIWRIPSFGPQVQLVQLIISQRNGVIHK